MQRCPKDTVPASPAAGTSQSPSELTPSSLVPMIAAATSEAATMNAGCP